MCPYRCSIQIHATATTSLHALKGTSSTARQLRAANGLQRGTGPPARRPARQRGRGGGPLRRGDRRRRGRHRRVGRGRRPSTPRAPTGRLRGGTAARGADRTGTPGPRPRCGPARWRRAEVKASKCHCNHGPASMPAARPSSFTSTPIQPISGCSVRPTVPPSATDRIWPPKQSPRTGTPARSAARMKSISGSTQWATCGSSTDQREPNRTTWSTSPGSGKVVEPVGSPGPLHTWCTISSAPSAENARPT